MLIENKLLFYGVSNSTIKHMKEINPLLDEITEKEFDEKIKLLESFDCSELQIVDIITSNSNIFSLNSKDIYKLYLFLQELGFSSLNILFDSNPFILNLELFEVKNYFQKEMSNNKCVDNIVEELESNPLLFNEM